MAVNERGVVYTATADGKQSDRTRNHLHGRAHVLKFYLSYCGIM